MRSAYHLMTANSTEFYAAHVRQVTQLYSESICSVSNVGQFSLFSHYMNFYQFLFFKCCLFQDVPVATELVIGSAFSLNEKNA
jgi:hypothetical protein